MVRPKKDKSEIIHKSPLIAWIVDEQPCSGRELSQAAGINEATWSNVANGRADMSTTTLWQVMKAIATLYPAGSVAKVVHIIEARAEGVRPPNLGEQLAFLIDVADEEELEQAFLSIGKRIFSKSSEDSNVGGELQSAHR